MIRAHFIGIDRYTELQVPDLTGATRDAKALWALFSDTFTDADCQLIVDHEATAQRIRKTMAETLGEATPDDTVIVSFSGHGTHDHRLVAHDSMLSDYVGSTIPMRDLASHFKQSRAKSIIVILDCCFSGEAPARVFDDSPIDKDLPFESDTFTGSGRVMITASGLDQPAYEHPQRRHGLLTKAVIDVLTRGEGGMISLLTALDQVQGAVRAEAAGMGVSQNPVILGHVEAGLTIPALRKGDQFRLAFPEVGAPRVGGGIGELLNLGIPEAVVEAWRDRFPSGLNPLQLAAVNDFGILQGASLLAIAPTSAGKTFIGEMAAIRAIAEGRKVVFLLPYRALVNEKYEDFLDLYGNRLGLRVVRCTGDYLDQTGSLLKGKFDIAILTFEMFLSLAVGHPPVLNRLGLIVTDEAQFIADSHRGIVVELLLTYLRSLRAKGIMPQLVLLSATIGDLNHFDKWLDVPVLRSDSRPVPLRMGVVDRSGTYQCVDAEGQERVEQLLPPGAVVQRKDKAGSQDLIVPLIRRLLSNEGAREKVLVFRGKKGQTEGCAGYLARDLGLSPATTVIEALPSHDLSGASGGLRNALSGGVAFHSANLTREERIVIERAFRDPAGAVRVLVATSTVAAGVNTPASTVVIVEHERPWENVSYSVAEIKNMAGRAGRLGFRETGTAILLAETPWQREQLFRKFVVGAPERITSSFQDKSIGTWLLRLLAQTGGIKEDELIGIVANTYGGYLKGLADPGWQKTTEKQLEDLVPRMADDGLLERDAGMLRLTLLGMACGASSLSLESSLRLIEMIRAGASGGLSAETLMALIQALPEMDATYTPLSRRGQSESEWLRVAGGLFGRGVVSLLQRRAQDAFAYYARAKRACILKDWTAGIATADMEARYTLNRFQGAVAGGDIRSMADATRFHLRSASQIVALIAQADMPSPESIEEVLRQLEVGIPADALGLLELPVTLARGEYLALVSLGIKRAEDVWKASRREVEGAIGVDRFAQLERVRPIPKIE